MNEKLKQEFERFLDEVEGTPRMYHPEEQIEWAEDIAEHFYNLAMEEVRKEVLRLNEINKDIAREKATGPTKWQEGVTAGYCDVISFIDNLTK